MAILANDLGTEILVQEIRTFSCFAWAAPAPNGQAIVIVVKGFVADIHFNCSVLVEQTFLRQFCNFYINSSAL